MAVCYLGINRLTPRESTRFNVVFRTDLRGEGEADRSVSIRNLSSRGLMGTDPNPPHIGENVMLLLPGIGWTLTNVRWRLGDRFGGRFVDPVSMKDFWRANPPFDDRDSRLRRNTSGTPWDSATKVDSSPDA